MIDVTTVKCEVGDVVTLIGRSGNTVLTVERVADAASMSPYELLTGLRSRVEKNLHRSVAVKRAVIIILDGVGIGEAPDAAEYGDAGSDTLGNVARASGG